ncbi:helix-turn-helix domain-containing protein [Paenibacillus barengoltzii]|uniref:helix-turn-helix domain-containing protein n=1 Tax=Paenibacillus barengoltzii TaxID=343517 RepID=UPI0013DF2D1B|nr:S24 family peptidase [Paenibacillus barengoltzii]
MYEIFERLLAEHNVTAYRVAKETGITTATFTSWKQGKYTPKQDKLQKIADYFGVSIDYLMGRTQDPTPIKLNNVIENVEMVKIPIYGEIRAGYNSLAQQDIIGYEIVAKDSVADGEYFFLIVKGDSMIEEGIREGMRVLVRKQRTCQHGKIGVVVVNGDEGTLKRVYYEDDNVILQAANRNIPPRVYPIDEVMIQGQVTQVIFDV